MRISKPNITFTPVFLSFSYKSLSPHLSQGLQQARTASEVDFQNICEEHSIVDKLYTLDMMCAQQGIGDGATE